AVDLLAEGEHGARRRDSHVGDREVNGADAGTRRQLEGRLGERDEMTKAGVAQVGELLLEGMKEPGPRRAGEQAGQHPVELRGRAQHPSFTTARVRMRRGRSKIWRVDPCSSTRPPSSNATRSATRRASAR